MLDSSTCIYNSPTIKFHYTYMIINLLINKFYIGVRTSSIHPSKDIGKNYFSTSADKIFIKDQKENPQNYEYRILGIFENKKLAYLNEKEMLLTYNVRNNKSFYNKTANNAFNSFYYSKLENENKIIQQYDLNQNLINEGTFKFFKNFFNIHNILKCVRGERRLCGGYVWKYKDDETFIFPNFERTGKIIQRYDYNKNLIDEGVISFFREKGFNYKGIHRCCNGERKTYKEFLWKFKDDDNYVWKPLEKTILKGEHHWNYGKKASEETINKRSESMKKLNIRSERSYTVVYQKDFLNNIIDEGDLYYFKLKGYNHHTIYDCCKGKYKSHKKFKWEFKNT